jgi:hypothetical protein
MTPLFAFASDAFLSSFDHLVVFRVGDTFLDQFFGIGLLIMSRNGARLATTGTADGFAEFAMRALAGRFGFLEDFTAAGQLTLGLLKISILDFV